jgi:hypothetical protein
MKLTDEINSNIKQVVSFYLSIDLVNFLKKINKIMEKNTSAWVEDAIKEKLRKDVEYLIKQQELVKKWEGEIQNE